MSFANLNLTNEGKSAMLRAMGGANIVFTRIALGNGNIPEDIFNVNRLSNVVCYGTITDYKRDEGTALLKWMLNSETIDNEFKWTEYGVMATLDEGEEFLFSYAYDKSSYPQPIGNALANITVEINITVGDVENITANVSEYSAYAGKEEFEKHCKSTNPHNITAETLGLENVENSKVQDTSVNFTEHDSNSYLNSGETVGVIFGKLKKIVKSFIQHLSATNPHKLTAKDINAAPSAHYHSATDVNSGVLSILRGGTGATDCKSALENLTKNNNIPMTNGKGLKGYLSSGNIANMISTYGNNILIGDNVSEENYMHIKAGSDINITTNSVDKANLKWWVFGKDGVLSPGMNDQAYKIGAIYSPVYDIYSVNGITTTSDRKKKENIIDCIIGSELIKRLSFKEFNFLGDDKKSCGLIAQEVFEVMQELGISNSSVYTATLIDDPEHRRLTDEEILNTDDELICWGLNYEQITNYILSAVKNMEHRISAIERRLKM